MCQVFCMERRVVHNNQVQLDIHPRAHLHTRGPGVHPRVKDRDDDAPTIVLGVFGEKLSDTCLFLRQQAPNRKVTINDACHISNATVTVGKTTLGMFPLYCATALYINQKTGSAPACAPNAPDFEVRLPTNGTTSSRDHFRYVFQRNAHRWQHSYTSLRHYVNNYVHARTYTDIYTVDRHRLDLDAVGAIERAISRC